MTDILVNALSVTNQSGLHVLAGHLEQLAGTAQIVVLTRQSMRELKNRLGGRVIWIDAPENTAHWAPRAMWEFQGLGKIARCAGADFYFTPSGIAASFLRIPQIVFCQNPWALVPAARRKTDALKAWLQRSAYRNAMRRAEVMVFNSEYMRQAYRQNAGFNEKRSIIASQAADEETRRRSEHWKNRPRKPGQILCVSAMASHKNIEAVVRSLEKMVRLGYTAATMQLVGPWPDPEYEKKIRKLVASLGLADKVNFAGFVSREELDGLYAESQVFCLMSRCESFGIPAIEAQLFGTPVICSNVCAVPEICGDGGLFFAPDDVDGIAAALNRLLTNDAEWNRFSVLARRNAEKFSWEICSRPLIDLFKSADERSSDD